MKTKLVWFNIVGNLLNKLLIIQLKYRERERAIENRYPNLPIICLFEHTVTAAVWRHKTLNQTPPTSNVYTPNITLLKAQIKWLNQTFNNSLAIYTAVQCFLVVSLNNNNRHKKVKSWSSQNVTWRCLISSFFCSRNTAGIPPIFSWALRSNSQSSCIKLLAFLAFRNPVKFICIVRPSGSC